MDFLLFLVLLIIEGGIVGGLARLALPGPDPMSIGQTIGIGVAGSFIAGVLAYLLLGTGAGFLLAFAVTFGLVYAVRRSRGGSLTRPAGRRRLDR